MYVLELPIIYLGQRQLVRILVMMFLPTFGIVLVFVIVVLVFNFFAVIVVFMRRV